MPADLPRADFETALLDAIHRFFRERGTGNTDKLDESEMVSGRRLQLATTILFLQMIAADHGARHDEHQTLLAVVSRMLGIGGDDAAILIRVSEEHVKTPLPELLRTLQQRCSLVQKKNVVESMWQLAFADAELAGHEESVVRKVAQARGLSTADLFETKIIAREAFLQSG